MYSILDRSYRVWCSFLPAYRSEYGQMLSREYLLHSQVTAHQSRDFEFFQILSPISLGKGLDEAPMPLDAPVTSAILFASLLVVVLLLDGSSI